MTETDTEALDGVTEEELADCPEPLTETVIDLTDRVEALEQAVERRKQRYKVLRNIVAAKTDLDEETIDQLVDQQLEKEGGR